MSDDLIRRSDAIDAIMETCCYCSETKVLTEIRNLPTIKPKRGKWEIMSVEPIVVPLKWSDGDDRKPIYKTNFKCSNCGFRKDFIDWHTAQYNFCPNCGADMREREGE